MTLLDAAPPPTASGGPGIEVRLLDGFRLEFAGSPIGLAPAAERLVAYLALHGGSLTRSQVAGALWPDRTEDRAGACLRSALWRANSACGASLGTAGPEPDLLVRAGRNQLALSPHRLDAHSAERAAHDQLVGRPPVDPEVLCGRLLPMWDDDWVVLRRERLRLLCLAGLEQMASSLLAAGELYRAIEAGCAVIAAEPLQESAYRVVVEAHARLGNRAEAYRQYELCRSILCRELDLEPSPDLTAVVEALRHGRPR